MTARARRVDERPGARRGYSAGADAGTWRRGRGARRGNVPCQPARRRASPTPRRADDGRRRPSPAAAAWSCAEAEALQSAGATALDGTFARGGRLLAGVAGRVVVTGMGKSGHVARKIAATLASTGTPALFVHPAEASHGDLGMITPQDAVLALSNSGETTELRDLILYTRRFAIPLIGHGRPGAAARWPRRPTSCLLLPEVGEACPMGLAPTTSTTCMLALGDALAVALLERRGFSRARLRRVPSGRQARQPAAAGRAADAPGRRSAAGRARRPASPTPSCEMTQKRLGCVGVVDDDGRLVGIITDGDLRRHMAPGHPHRTAGEIMTAQPAHDRAAGAGGRGRRRHERAAASGDRAVRGRRRPPGRRPAPARLPQGGHRMSGRCAALPRVLAAPGRVCAGAAPGAADHGRRHRPRRWRRADRDHSTGWCSSRTSRWPPSPAMSTPSRATRRLQPDLLRVFYANDRRQRPRPTAAAQQTVN